MVSTVPATHPSRWATGCDYYEIHEAFASTVLVTLAAWHCETFCHDRLGADAPLGSIDRNGLNVNGSSLAAGHPFAAAGGRIVCSFAKQLAHGADLHLCGRRAGRRGDSGSDLICMTACLGRCWPGCCNQGGTSLCDPRGVEGHLWHRPGDLTVEQLAQ